MHRIKPVQFLIAVKISTAVDIHDHGEHLPRLFHGTIYVQKVRISERSVGKVAELLHIFGLI